MSGGLAGALGQAENRVRRRRERGRANTDSRLPANRIRRRTKMGLACKHLAASPANRTATQSSIGLNGTPPVGLARVRVTAADTGKVPNASATAASSGTDLNGRAAQFAAREVRDRLAAFVAQKQDCEPGQVLFAHGEVSGPKAAMRWEQAVDALWQRLLARAG